MAERGHSCPQQRASYEIGSKSKRLRLSEVAADKNVRAPPAVTDRLHACQSGRRFNPFPALATPKLIIQIPLDGFADAAFQGFALAPSRVHF